ncbi:MAG: methyltransferase domain-containing protein [Candidatus Eisenbacteria bacterium]
MTEGAGLRTPGSCPVCGGTSFRFEPVLWKELVESWGLSAEEADYVDRQQGLCCESCRCNLRSMTLASAIMDALNFSEGTFDRFCADSIPGDTLRFLEINEAGHLTPYLRLLKKYTFLSFPETDMQNMEELPDRSFDVVIHSDTLEHVPRTDLALRECRRVLQPGGLLAYTVPVITGRLGRRRDGLSPSYHGVPGHESEEMRVVTEYGADFWCEALAAGFRSVGIGALVFPDSVAVVARR